MIGFVGLAANGSTTHRVVSRLHWYIAGARMREIAGSMRGVRALRLHTARYSSCKRSQTLLVEEVWGSIYKGYHKTTKHGGHKKVLNLDTGLKGGRSPTEFQFLSEIQNRNPNVTHYYGSCLVDLKLWIIMDYYGGLGFVRFEAECLKSGTLEWYYVNFWWLFKRFLFLGVIHRDLKSVILITNGVEASGQMGLLTR